MTAAPVGSRPRDIALPPGWTLHSFQDVSSTNDVAKDLAARGAGHGTVVWAEQQRAGRGRHGRDWLSPPGNLYVSVLLRPSADPAVVAQLSLVAALAMTEAVATIAPHLDVRVKWPNDVLVGEAKISGLLLESSGAHDGGIDWVVIGSGVNVAYHPTLPDRPTTSLAALGVTDVTPDDVLQTYLRCLDELANRWLADGFAAVRPAWLARAAGIGTQAAVRMGDRRIAGRFIDVTEAGALILEMPDGSRRTVAAGDLVLEG